ncbi:hypothetical protein PR003_g27124 [Phytophthora rubi]|uniref:Uncharacterized protein n=1 Tax=Phytophthora rubi TaxID=129364 RepID=A0A6A3HUS7_9STRA|nr:hypothetical protein PR002_g26095 [Phytophthora rubi]KAE8974791.1 hypothetical protein PR001_g25887 [Phytophthora rubi]KAE9283438.1 hypothetical protein PR003_g27124 [Phytophthora rubi]
MLRIALYLYCCLLPDASACFSCSNRVVDWRAHFGKTFGSARRTSMSSRFCASV